MRGFCTCLSSRLISRWSAFLRGPVFLLAALCCYWLIVPKGLHLGMLDKLRGHWPAIFLAWIMANAFVVFKSKALQAAASGSGLRLSGLRAGRLFCEATVVGVLTWPGQLWSDAYKVGLLPEGSIRAKIHATLRFRVGSIAATLAVLLVSTLVVVHFGVPHVGLSASIGLVTVVTAGVAGCVLQWKKPGLIASVLPVAGWSIPATLSDAIAFGVLAHVTIGASPLLLACWYVILNAASTLSTLPLNIGVFDVACWAVLTRLFGADTVTVATAIALHRTLGPLNTVALGGASALYRILWEHTPALSVLPADPIPGADPDSRYLALGLE